MEKNLSNKHDQSLQNAKIYVEFFNIRKKQEEDLNDDDDHHLIMM